MIEIYTDGACSHNGTWKGGWGVVVVEDGKVVHSFGGDETETTNNRMEMKAVIGALDYVAEQGLDPENVTIHMDSAYVHNAFTQNWIANWQKNGWKNAKKQPVKNKDLWLEMLSYPIVKLSKVKGHADNEFNNQADSLAVYWRDK